MAGGGPRSAGRSSGGSGSNGRSRNELWSLLTEYFTPRRDCGVTLPSGPCGLIHVKNKRVQLIVDRREYLHSSICSDKDCETTTEAVFYKNPEKRVALLEGGRGQLLSGPPDPALVAKIQKSFIQLVNEFAATVKPGKVENTENQPVLYESCCAGHCDELIYLLEFGKIEELDRYPKEEYAKVMSCYHGGQAVGHHMSFFMFYIVNFFIGTKLLLYNNVENAPKLDSMYEYACDGQTFLPYQRKNLHLWMKDLDATTQMCKATFRCIYLYVYLRRKFEPEYKIETDGTLELGCGDSIWLRLFNYWQ
ncbi:uncharacterized protein LOC113205870 [Frankliniella occidentalis]|uniref:Uncharacterized protein LOC113205870 n=1 Tax=Frankliniella occidentalis TaxID=133901 RepID=A0A6J1S8Q6_FRAOC|nr:uncharacterized protein LOC113205870 [Frankliniella occidentalis]XP_052125240.1 uncharacterized protein LOC113205870 [Frankliniella occidentalis]